jgi:prevent-host-death family protein
MNVGTKDLKNRLGHYLRKVRDGEIVRVTERGQVVAEIRGVAAAWANEEAALAELESLGLISRGSGRFRAFKPIRLRR